MSSLKTAFNIEDLRLTAKAMLPKGLFEFIDRGVEDEVGLRRNRDAYDRIEMVPTTLAGHRSVKLGTTVLGRQWAMPFAIAPTGIVGLVWFEGEVAAAMAAAKAGVPYGLSTASITSLETVARKVPDAELWFQLYVWNQFELTLDLVRRAKDAGYRALVVTTDGNGGTNREYNQRNRFTVPMKLSAKATFDVLKRPGWIWRTMIPSLWAGGIPNFANYPPEYRSDVLGRSASGKSMAQLGFPVVSRDILCRLRDAWDGPLVVKGILHPRDAELAVGCGANAVVVSNHGGRTLDSAVSAIDALPHVVSAVGHQTEVLMDSGIRRGSDIVKALALGAKGVLVGRAPIWGTAVAGTEGAYHALRLLKSEVARVMAQTGYSKIDEIGSDCLWPLAPGGEGADCPDRIGIAV